MIQLKRAVIATVILLTVLILILGCGPNARHSSNTEVIVYEETGGLWKSQAYLEAQALIPTRKFLVFGAEWCGACTGLAALIDDANLEKDAIIWLNVEERWVRNFIRQIGGLRGVPHMIEVKPNGEFGERREGLGKILTYLLAWVETEGK